MNLKLATILILGLLSAAWANPAQAQNLLGGCVADPVSSQRTSNLSHGEFVVLAVTNGGMSCKSLLSAVEAADHIKMALLPATMVMMNPAVSEMIAASAQSMGIAVGGAAVLSVTVFGAVGFVTVYYLLKPRYDECKEQEMLAKIRAEAERITNLPARGSIVIKDGGV